MYPIVDCVWSDWGSWGTCTSTCAGGQQSRIRTIVADGQYGGVNCSETACPIDNNPDANCVNQTQQCNENTTCPSNYQNIFEPAKIIYA